MGLCVEEECIDRLFRKARSYNAWTDRPLAREQLLQIYELMKWGPTSTNGNPLRIVFACAQESRALLAKSMMGNNGAKVREAPAVAILGYDTRFYEHLPVLFPHDTKWPRVLASNEKLVLETAFRNSSLQAGYFIIAARALGLDCGPMSGFDHAGVERDFFPDGRVKVNLVCALGYGDDGRDLWDRLPRPSAEDVCSFR